MTKRQAIVKTWRIWKRIREDPESYRDYNNLCPLCVYAGGGTCNERCPLWLIRGRGCWSYTCRDNFLQAYWDGNYTAAKRHAGAVVRVLERLILSHGWKVPRR